MRYFIKHLLLRVLFIVLSSHCSTYASLDPLFDDDTSQLKSCSTTAPNVAIILPATSGEQYQVLGLLNNTGQLSWLTTVTNTSQFNLLYSATSVDIPLTLVLRDSTGSFAATTLTLTGNLILDHQTGVLIAQNGLVTATVGIDGTRLASFPLTDSPAVNFFQPVEPSRESYFFDDFVSFNAAAGGVFYGDTPWTISNNTYPSRVVSLNSTGSAIGITRLLTANNANSLNYLIKQVDPMGNAQGVRFGLGPCLNEWRIALPVLSVSLLNSFSVRVGMGDNPTSAPRNGIYFSYNDSVDGGVWQINTASAGVTTSQPTVPATAPTATEFQRLAFIVSADASHVDFFIDDVPVGTIMTTIPTGNDCSPIASILRTGGSGGMIDLDYWYFHYTFSLRR